MTTISSGGEMALAAQLLQGTDLALVPLSPRSASEAERVDNESSAPGWYDSSWDLQQGLEVYEGLPAGSLPSEWCELHPCIAPHENDDR